MAPDMPMRTAPLLVLACAAIALGGCTKDASLYPSLATREAERVSGTFQPAPVQTYVPSAPPPATLGKVGQLRADAQAAHTRFLAAAQRAQGPAAGRNSEVGSEAWSVAQVALADLSAAHSATMIPLADLDSMFAAAQNDGEDVSEIEKARGEVEAWVAAEDKVLDSY